VQSRSSCVLPLVLPAPYFRSARIKAPGHASRLTPDRNPYLGTAFHSLDKTARFRTTLPRSMLLAYPFGSSLSLPRTRSIRPLVHAAWLAPDCANSTRQTRCPVPSQRPRPLFRPPLPFRAFGPFPIKALTSIPIERFTESTRPIALRSPLPAVLIEPATDQRSRLATSRSAYCLTNLLEPSSLCS